MAERIVREWADGLLYQYPDGQYGLLLNSGEPVGEPFHAANDKEAVEKSAMVALGEFKKRKEGAKARVFLELLEGANKADMFDSLDNDELRRLKNLLFVWHDLAKREIDRRNATSERVVRIWADEVLLHLGENRYQITTPNGQPIGPEIAAPTDEAAIQECIFLSRERLGGNKE